MKHINTHKHSRPRIPASFVVCCALVLLAAAGAASSGGTGGREAFSKARQDLDAGRYSEAAANLLIARQELDIIGDYALYLLSDAYHRMGDHARSLEAVRSLLSEYPSSPLRKKARMAEIREAKDSGRDTALSLYEAYVRDFPDDDEAGFAYGVILKKNNDRAAAAAVFRKIFIKAGHLSQAARGELAPEEITVRDILDRASNLIKHYEFEDAERDLRQALATCRGNHRQEILRNLATALFKQKKYREAAEVYGQVDDLFFRARSLYRAGDRKGFESVLNTLIKRSDKKAGFLLLTVAADRRREKDFDRALQTYREILNNYPSDAEEALWGIGWTEYLSGEHKKAAETFSRLYVKYEEPKYLYWQARSTESAGEDASDLYAKVISSGDFNFYTALAFARSSRPAPQLASFDMPAVRERSRTDERVDVLISLGMRPEAVTELAVACRNASSLTDMLNSAARFQELGEFRRAVSLATRLPYSEKVHGFWYPLAFWDTVEKASQRNSLDPYIVLSVMREESRFDQAAKSPAGAYGLMQLMPQTAYRLDRSLNLGIQRPAQLTDPANNIRLGSFYLRSLLDEFRSLPHMLAAYNAGEAAVRSWQQRFDYRSADEFIEDIPYNETRNYVKKVLTSYFQYRRGYLQDRKENSGMDLILGRRS